MSDSKQRYLVRHEGCLYLDKETGNCTRPGCSFIIPCAIKKNDPKTIKARKF